MSIFASINILKYQKCGMPMDLIREKWFTHYVSFLAFPALPAVFLCEVCSAPRASRSIGELRHRRLSLPQLDLPPINVPALE